MGGIVLMKKKNYKDDINLLKLNDINDVNPPYKDIDPPDFHHISLVYFDLITPNINKPNNTDI